MSALRKTQQFLAQSNVRSFPEPVTAPKSTARDPGPAVPFIDDIPTPLGDILRRKAMNQPPPLLVTVPPIPDSTTLKARPDTHPAFPDIRPFLTPDEVSRFEATNVDLDNLSLTIGTFAESLSPEAVLHALGSWRALNDLLANILQPRADHSVSFQGGAAPHQPGPATPTPVPLALVTKAWLAFLAAARSRAPSVDLGIDLPVAPLLPPGGLKPPVADTINAAKRAGAAAPPPTTAAVGPMSAAQVIQMGNELAAERKWREAAEQKAREAERALDDVSNRFRDMTRVYKNMEDLKGVQDTVCDFNMLPVHLSDAMRRIAAQEADMKALRSRIDDYELAAESMDTDVKKTYKELVSEIAAHKATKTKLMEVRILYENLQQISGATEKDNVANIDLVRQKVEEVDELRHQVFQLEADREATDRRRSELNERLTRLTEENAAMVKELGVLRTNTAVAERNLKEREAELEEATANLRALQSIVGELKNGNNSMLRAFENKLEKADRKNKLLLERFNELEGLVRSVQETRVEPLLPMLESIRREVTERVEVVRQQCEKDIVGIYHQAYGIIMAGERALEAARKEHADFVTMHNETVSDFTVRVTALETECLVYQAEIADFEESVRELEASLKATADERDAQRTRADGLDRDLASARRTIEVQAEEIAILQKAQAQLEVLMGELRAVKADRDRLKQELKLEKSKVEAVSIRAKVAEEKNKKLATEVVGLKDTIVERDAEIVSLKQQNETLKQFADNVMKEVANERKRAEDAVLEVRRLSLELEKKLNSPETVLANKYRELINMSLRIRVLDIPFSRPVSRSPAKRNQPPATSRGPTWQDLTQDRLLTFFEDFKPLVAEVDERGLYRLQLPEGSGQWHISARGLLIIRNVEQDFPGIIIPPMPGGLKDAIPRVSYSRQADRPRLPMDLPVHAYQPMDKEPQGMSVWMDRHVDRRNLLPLTTVKPTDEAHFEGDEPPAERVKTAPGEKAIPPTARTMATPAAQGPPERGEGAKLARTMPGVTQPAADFRQMEGWRTAQGGVIATYAPPTVSSSAAPSVQRLPHIGPKERAMGSAPERQPQQRKPAAPRANKSPSHSPSPTKQRPTASPAPAPAPPQPEAEASSTSQPPAKKRESDQPPSASHRTVTIQAEPTVNERAEAGTKARSVAGDAASAYDIGAWVHEPERPPSVIEPGTLERRRMVAGFATTPGQQLGRSQDDAPAGSSTVGRGQSDMGALNLSLTGASLELQGQGGRDRSPLSKGGRR